MTTQRNSPADAQTVSHETDLPTRRVIYHHDPIHDLSGGYEDVYFELGVEAQVGGRP